MNPKLIKFAVELQNNENDVTKKEPKFISLSFKGLTTRLASVKVPVNENKD